MRSQFTFHFFHSHLRSDKFPMDHVIFSGRVSEAELKHERGRLYDRLKAADKLEVAPGGAAEWNDWKSVETTNSAKKIFVRR